MLLLGIGKQLRLYRRRAGTPDCGQRARVLSFVVVGQTDPNYIASFGGVSSRIRSTSPCGKIGKNLCVEKALAEAICLWQMLTVLPDGGPGLMAACCPGDVRQGCRGDGKPLLRMNHLAATRLTPTRWEPMMWPLSLSGCLLVSAGHCQYSAGCMGRTGLKDWVDHRRRTRAESL